MITIRDCDKKLPFVFTAQLLCLVIMGIVEFLNMTEGCFLPINVHLISNAGIVLSIMGLWAVTLWKSPRSVLQRDVILGVAMVLWFLIVEMNRRINYHALQSLTIFVIVYLVALPFAALTRDQERQTGIRLVSGFYIAAAIFQLALGIILVINGGFSGTLNEKVYWDGARLLIISHPNISSRIFMIAIALCMGFLTQTKKIWAKTLLLIATILLFAALSLTNTRAAIIVTCCILAGNVFFLVCKKNPKRILLGAVAAMLAVVILFLYSGWLFEWNANRLLNQSSLQKEQEQTLVLEVSDSQEPDSSYEVILPEGVPLDVKPSDKLRGNNNSDQGTLLSDLPTLNNRTAIWAAVFQKIRNDPMILLRGTVDSRLVMGRLHTHNAWLEALIVLGLPGFLLVLFFTWEAAWASLRLLLHSGAGMFQKNIALLTLATMAASMLEPSLFVTYTEWTFINFFFFLCLGYLTLWNKQLSKKE